MSRVRLTAVAVLAASLAGAGAASATTTIGQTAPLYSAHVCNLGNLLIQGGTVGGPSYVVPPEGGTITSWSTEGGDEIGSLKLKIVRPLPDGKFVAVGESVSQDIFPRHPNTFPLTPGIRVQGGDLLGLVETYGNPGCAFPAPVGGANAGDTLLYTSSGIDPPLGYTFPYPASVNGRRLNVSATVEPDPLPAPPPPPPSDPPPALPPPPPRGGTGAVTPAVGKLTLQPSRFRAARSTRVRFTLSVAARTRFTIVRRVGGRLVRVRGSFTRAGAAGTNTFRFKGQFAGRRLRPGSYRLVATPSAGVRTGRAASVRFSIVR